MPVSMTQDPGAAQTQHFRNVFLDLSNFCHTRTTVDFLDVCQQKSFTKAPSNFYLTFSEGDLSFYRSGLMNFEVTRVLRK